MTNAPPSSAPGRTNGRARPEPRAAFRIDGTDARRNIRLPPPPGISDPDRARAFGRGLCNQDSASMAHYCRDEGNLRGASGKTMPAWLTPLRDTVSRWSAHKDARLGAALAY